jgi:hypothetical protein
MSRICSVTFTLALLVAQTDVATMQSPPESDSVTVRFDYTGAEALLNAVERDSLTDADVMKLLEVRGLRAMVDNVTRYAVTYDRDQFQAELRAFVQTHQSIRSPFGLGQVFRNRAQVRSLIADLQGKEATIIKGMLKQLEPFRPRTGKLAATIYFVTGGSSDGFVLDGDDEPAFFVALDKANGDLPGVQQNMTHELYHVMQKAIAKRVPRLAAVVRDPAQLPPHERLVATTFWEGTANYAADALSAEGSGSYLEMWRSRYRRNAEPARIKENFGLFDTLLADLRAGRIAWDEAQRVGFFGDNDARLYFVGYEMAKAIDRHRSAKRIGELLEQPPSAFFQEYITLYRQQSGIVARFTAETEAYLETLR